MLGRLVSVSLDHVEAPTPTWVNRGRERERGRERVCFALLALPALLALLAMLALLALLKK